MSRCASPGCSQCRSSSRRGSVDLSGSRYRELSAVAFRPDGKLVAAGHRARFAVPNGKGFAICPMEVRIATSGAAAAYAWLAQVGRQRALASHLP